MTNLWFAVLTTTAGCPIHHSSIVMSGIFARMREPLFSVLPSFMMDAKEKQISPPFGFAQGAR